MEKKRILFVPDYFWPADPGLYIDFQAALAEAGADLVILTHGRTLDDSIIRVENYCAKNDVDLIVSHGTGCVFIASIVSAPRLFIDPKWDFLPESFDGNTSTLRDYEVSEREKWHAQELTPLKIVTRGKLPAKCWITDEGMDDEENVMTQLNHFYEVNHHRSTLFPSANIAKEIITSWNELTKPNNQ